MTRMHHVSIGSVVLHNASDGQISVIWSLLLCHLYSPSLSCKEAPSGQILCLFITSDMHDDQANSQSIEPMTWIQISKRWMRGWGGSKRGMKKRQKSTGIGRRGWTQRLQLKCRRREGGREWCLYSLNYSEESDSSPTLFPLLPLPPSQGVCVTHTMAVCGWLRSVCCLLHWQEQINYCNV